MFKDNFSVPQSRRHEKFVEGYGNTYDINSRVLDAIQDRMDKKPNYNKPKFQPHGIKVNFNQPKKYTTI